MVLFNKEYTYLVNIIVLLLFLAFKLTPLRNFSTTYFPLSILYEKLSFFYIVIAALLKTFFI